MHANGFGVTRSPARPPSAGRSLPSSWRSPLSRSGTALGLALITLLSACNAPPGINPWRDDSISCTVWTTPSQDSILASGHASTIRQRDIEPSSAPFVSQQVPHYPLWWEDPFEDKGDLNGEFAWTWQDYFAMPYSYGRFMLNTVAWPVSAVCTPPGTPMVSDGCVPNCRQHDAEKGVSNDPEGTQRDFTHDTTGGIQPTSAPASELPPACS